MKKIFLAVCASIIGLVTFASETTVNEKALEVFAKTFPTIKNVSWADGENFSEAYFVEEGTTNRIRYNKAGEVISTIRYYPADKLPVFLHMKVKNRYPGRQIRCVTELATDAGTCYFISVEDAKSWLQLKADASGNMEVENKYRKL